MTLKSVLEGSSSLVASFSSKIGQDSLQFELPSRIISNVFFLSWCLLLTVRPENTSNFVRIREQSLTLFYTSALVTRYFQINCIRPGIFKFGFQIFFGNKLSKKLNTDHKGVPKKVRFNSQLINSITVKVISRYLVTSAEV